MAYFRKCLSYVFPPNHWNLPDVLNITVSSFHRKLMCKQVKHLSRFLSQIQPSMPQFQALHHGLAPQALVTNLESTFRFLFPLWVIQLEAAGPPFPLLQMYFHLWCINTRMIVGQVDVYILERLPAVYIWLTVG